MGVFAEVVGTPAVERLPDGRVAIWAGDASDPVGLVVDDVGAVTLAGRLVSVVDGGLDLGDKLGDLATVERIRIFPPEQGAPGRLVVETDSGPVTLFIAWGDLVALADAARVATEAAKPAGSS